MRVGPTLRFPVFLIILAAAAPRAMPAAPAAAQAAPEFPRSDAAGWVNSPPLTMSGLRGKVVVLDVWTFG